MWRFPLPGGELFQGFFFGRPKLGGGGFWYCSLEMKENFGSKAPCCCILVDGCVVRDMWKPLVAEKNFHPARSMRRKMRFWNENWLVERPQCRVVECQELGVLGSNPTVVGFMTHTQS